MHSFTWQGREGQGKRKRRREGRGQGWERQGRRGEGGAGGERQGRGRGGEESRYIRMYVRSDTMYVCTKVGEASWTILYSGAKAYVYVRTYVRMYVQYAESAYTYMHA